MKTLPGKVTISRNSSDEVKIEFQDELSGLRFATAIMSCEDFAMAVTGLSLCPAKVDVHRLEWVGKQRITERRSIECPIDTYDKAVLAAWLKENAQDEGWILSTYLGSQGSVSKGSKPGTTLLCYTVTKYVDVPPEYMPAKEAA